MNPRLSYLLKKNWADCLVVMGCTWAVLALAAWAISGKPEPGLSSLRDGAPAGLHQRLQSPIAGDAR
jgi:hypothetical protein